MVSRIAVFGNPINRQLKKQWEDSVLKDYNKTIKTHEGFISEGGKPFDSPYVDKLINMEVENTPQIQRSAMRKAGLRSEPFEDESNVFSNSVKREAALQAAHKKGDLEGKAKKVVKRTRTLRPAIGARTETQLQMLNTPVTRRQENMTFDYDPSYQQTRIVQPEDILDNHFDMLYPNIKPGDAMGFSPTGMMEEPIPKINQRVQSIDYVPDRRILGARRNNTESGIYYKPSKPLP